MQCLGGFDLVAQGLRDLIEHDVTGLMVPRSDSKALAATLDSLDNGQARQ